MRVFKFFFWFFLAALLTTTIPHVAYFFRAYEPLDDGYGVLWWIVSYALATGIDVTIFLLCSVLARGKERRRDGGFVWVFILFLTCVSCYMNYEHATEFQTPMLVHATQLVLPVVGSINPYLASFFPVLIVAFTWMSGKLEGKEETTTELQNRLNALRERNTLQSQLATAKHRNFVGKIARVTSTAKSVKYALQSEQADTTEENQEPGQAPNQDREPGASMENQEEQFNMEEETEPSTGKPLSFIEQSMYTAIMSNPVETSELLDLASQHTLEDFTAMLRERYKQYAGYITPVRVANVLQYAHDNAPVRPVQSASGPVEGSGLSTDREEEKTPVASSNGHTHVENATEVLATTESLPVFRRRTQ